ncbi:MAG TPA: dTDP-4-dehydrorhamnose 3,5-epimerase [Bacteroidales bacterium]|nr:dTDP-4-dehydrorhamnose 3,5-epimerase [Bacteroidales bacterium]
MNIIETGIDGLLIIKPNVYGDSRGYFMESFKLNEFQDKVCNTVFVQDNESKSKFGVLRGLHFQKPPYVQAKLVRVLQGKVLDVAVDLRKNSDTFGKHFAVELSEENKLQFFIPRGFAHGFIVLSENAVFSYKVDNAYAPESEGGIRFDCPQLAIDWKIETDKLILSEKDRLLPELKNAYTFE